MLKKNKVIETKLKVYKDFETLNHNSVVKAYVMFRSMEGK